MPMTYTIRATEVNDRGCIKGRTFLRDDGGDLLVFADKHLALSRCVELNAEHRGKPHGEPRVFFEPRDYRGEP